MDHLPHGGCRGHPRLRARTTVSAGTGSRSPSISTPSMRRLTRSTSRRRFRTPRCASSPWAQRGIDHAEVPDRRRDRPDGAARGRGDRGGRGRIHHVARRATTSRRTAASPRRSRPRIAELLGIASAIGRTGKGVFEINVDTVDVERRPRAHAPHLRGERAPAVGRPAAAPRPAGSTPTGGSSRASKRARATVWSCAVKRLPARPDSSCRSADG